MSNETDADKMAELVRELNQELLDKKKDVQSSPKTASDLPRPA
jgi:hypothetical protein